ncbi:hypothetical protein [Apilactobacillus micheneri]|uniref:hypothetical protein n=1 Tax=Apilactobacillus micheneri TaxID=1899430 RepID=UPI00112D1CA4|nr:hypothetical protein [Apilactobacillus micheneri]TPR50754.1 hypothetical protein DY126_06815 [Apilactobacillus micheneri]
MTKELHIKDGKELIQKLKDMGAKDYCSFMVYPKSYDDNVTGKAEVGLDKDYIQNDLFKDINNNNGLMFVGLNAASRDNEFNDFQMMHDTTGTDYRTLQRINNANKYKDLILGSFICDVLSNVVSTHLISLTGIINSLDHNLPQFDPIENPIDIPKCFSKMDNKEPKVETFSFKQIYRLSFDKLEKINNHVKREKEKAEVDNGIIQKQTRAFESMKKEFINSKKDEYESVRKELKKSRSRLFKNISYINELNEKLKIEKRKAAINLYNHILYYDIPAFVTLVRMIKPKVLICFGHDATHLAQLIVDKCLPNMDLQVRYTEHFASLGRKEKGNNTFKQKGKDLDDLIDSILEEPKTNLKIENGALK